MGKALSPAGIMGGPVNISFRATPVRGAAPRSQAAAALARLTLWLGRHRERKQMRKDLPKLTSEMLRDLHLTRKQAQELAGRPFWRA